MASEVFSCEIDVILRTLVEEEEVKALLYFLDGLPKSINSVQHSDCF